MNCMRDRFVAKPGEDVVESLLDRARGSLKLIFQAGCNHVDFGPHAILMSPVSPDRDAVIGFEFAVFKSVPCVRTLAAQLGFFGWSIATNRCWASHDQIATWSERTFAEWKLPYPQECREIFWSNLRECPSLSRRMAR